MLTAKYHTQYSGAMVKFYPKKINRYKVDKFDRKKIAKAGKKKYFRFFNSTLVANYILSKTFGFENNEKFIWDKNF